MNLSPAHKQRLREIAWRSIRHALQHQSQLEITDLDHVSPLLAQTGASFVSLHKHHKLRGCVGSLEAERPLIVDVNYNAYAAAFTDQRFPSVVAEEL
ncbi:MAG: AMMECR1 domain-containing protein, partial [Thiohalomonadales bacterium]